MAASDFGAGALIFAVSLTAAPCTRHYRSMASFHCVSVSKKCLAAPWSFIIFEKFSFCLFSRDFYESRGFFWFESQQEWSRSNVFSFNPCCCLIHVLLLLFTAIVFNIRSVIVVDVDHALTLVDLAQANLSTSTLSWNCGEHSDVIFGRILLSCSFEISMKNSDSLFDLIVTGLISIFWVKLFSIARG